MSRIEIIGQFNVDNPICSGLGPMKIERNPTSISTAGISDWNQFCDSIDEALSPLAKTKAIAKISSLFLYPYILIVVIVNSALPTKQYTGALVWPIIIAYFIIHCRTRTRLAAVMEKVKGVCHHNQSNSFSYSLESERWGGCNKPHVKRYYIEVEMTDPALGKEPNLAIADVEQQAQSRARDDNTGAMAASNCFSTPAPGETETAATSLEDTLRLEMTVSNYFSTSTPAGKETTSLEDMLKR